MEFHFRFKKRVFCIYSLVIFQNLCTLNSPHFVDFFFYFPVITLILVHLLLNKGQRTCWTANQRYKQKGIHNIYSKMGIKLMSSFSSFPSETWWNLLINTKYFSSFSVHQMDNSPRNPLTDKFLLVRENIVISLSLEILD